MCPGAMPEWHTHRAPPAETGVFREETDAVPDGTGTVWEGTGTVWEGTGAVLPM